MPRRLKTQSYELSVLPEPDVKPWTFTATAGRPTVGPISAIVTLTGMFFYAFKERIALGSLGEGFIALAALALGLGAIVWVVRNAASSAPRGR